MNQEIDFTQKEHKKHIEEGIKFCKESLCGCEVTEKNSNGFKYRIRESDCNKTSFDKEIAEIVKHNSEAEWELVEKSQKLKAKKEQIENLESNFEYQKSKLEWIFYIGIICSVIGAMLWYFRIQVYQDLILKNQAMNRETVTKEISEK